MLAAHFTAHAVRADIARSSASHFIERLGVAHAVQGAITLPTMTLRMKMVFASV